LWLTQLAIFGLGLCLAAAVVVVDYRVSESLAYPVFAIACLLLLAVLLQGRIALGAQRWLALGPFSFQPSEPAKLAVILCLARYFSHRIEPGGYSMRQLFRPLNPSRPLAMIAAILYAWQKPALADPMGELARFIRTKVGPAAPAIDDLLWFRVLLCAGLASALAIGVLVILRLEQQRALLDPWPEGRRRRLIIAWAAVCVSLVGLLVWHWNAALVRDPFGFVISRLWAAAAPGGHYALLQPGYGLRILLVLLAALYLAASAVALRYRRDHLVDLVIAPIDLLAVPAVLVLVEPDLGTAGIILLIGFSMILVAGIQLRTLLILGAMSVLVAAVGWFGILKDYQKRRILTFIDPEHDIQGAGWNAVQSLIAVGSGRWTGKGHLGGTQSQLDFLPEQHTDFAFSVWAEEQGFVGCLLVIGLYLLLLLLAIAVAREAREAYGALVAIGVAALVFWQAFINIGMVIGVLPVVGVTLPLFSYGGSSVMTVMIGVGLLLNIHARRRVH
jgi:rod shape determining protein RodA